MVRYYAGSHYGESCLAEDRPVNLTAQYVNITARSLVPKTPRLFLSTFSRPAAATVKAAESWANDELVRMHFAVTLRRIVHDALFSGGVGRVALVKPTEAAKAVWGPVAGQPLFSRIDTENFARDPFSGEFGEDAWQAHYFRVPLAAAKEYPGFGKGRKDLEASPATAYDESGAERVGTISRGTAGADDEFEEMVGLWEFYLPRHREVLTFVTDAGGQPQLQPDRKPLATDDWIGPDTGPYHLLGYQWVADNGWPKGPVMDLFDLDLVANQFLRKLIGDMDSLKEFMLFADAADADRVRKAPSGSYEYCQDPKSVVSVAFNGAQVQLAQGTFLLVRQLFDQFGGNLSLQAGLGPQAKTARQESLLNQNAGAGVADLSETTLNYVSEVGRSLLWFWWKHPHLQMESEVGPAGLPEYAQSRRVGPRGTPGLARDLPFDRLRMRVDPYSLQPTTPREQLAELREVVKTEILPMLPILQRSGTAFDAAAYVQLISELLDNPRFSEILTLEEPPEGVLGGPPGGSPEAPGMPSATTRNYVRENVSEATQGGQERNLMQQLMTGNSPGGRPNGTPQPMGV